MRRALIIVGCLVALAVFAATQSQYFSGSLIVAGTISDPGGTNWIKEAPVTGTNYVRKNGAWEELPAGTSLDGDLVAGDGIIMTGTLTDRLANSGDVTIIAQVEEAASDGNPYVRRDGVWNLLSDWASLVGHNHDHGGLTGLSDDDHTQYHTDARGDARYSLLAHAHSGVYEPVFSKGGLIAGVGISLSGTLSGRLVGSGDVTVTLGSHGHDWADISGEPDFAVVGHAHGASDITSGTLAIARGGTGGGDAATARANLNVPTRTGGDASGTWGISITGDAGTLDGVDSTGFATSGHNHSGTYEPVFSKGSLVAGTGVTLGGTLTDRLVGTGNVTINATGTGVTDHGDLTGLGDDDHTQYHTDARGDARYLRLTGGTVSGLTTFSSGIIQQAAGASSVHSVGVFDSDPTTSGALMRSRSLSNLKADLGTMPPQSHTHPEYAPFVFVTVSEVTDTNEDTTFRSVLGTVKSGYSATLGANTLPSGTVLHVRASGKFQGDAGFEHNVRLKIGSSYYIEWICNEPASGKALSGTPWNLEALVTVATAGSSATVFSTAWMVYQTDESVPDSSTSASYAFRTRGTENGTLNTTTSNAVDITYAGMISAATSFTCSHFILQQF